MKTPVQLVDNYGLSPTCESRRVDNWHYAYRAERGDKPQYLSSFFLLQASGALSQTGDSQEKVDRIRQVDLAPMLGIASRPTLTRHLMRWSEPDPQWTPEKRSQQSAKMMKIIAGGHPHWRKDDAENFQHESDQCSRPTDAGVERLREETVSPPDHGGGVPAPAYRDDFALHELKGSAPPQEMGRCGVDSPGSTETDPGPLQNSAPMASCPPGADDGPGSSPLTGLREPGPNNPSRPFILVRNPGWGAPNTYSLTLPPELRPGLKAESDSRAVARRVAGFYGDDRYDPKAKVNGWKSSFGWSIDPKLPTAPDCSCKQQRSFQFQEKCPKCEGRGYVIGGSMTDNERMILHWFKVHGIDTEIRRCDRCKRSYDHESDSNYPKCRQCGEPGRVTKEKGILEGKIMAAIAKIHGLHKSTVGRCFRTYRRIGLVRSVPCRRWRECCGQRFDKPICPKCGNKSAPIKKSEPQKHLWLISRRFDRELVAAERERFKALVKRYRKFLDQGQMKSLENAVQLALKVLGEWAGQEHQLFAFYAEMRRRLNTQEYGRFLAVLFPPNTS